GEMLTPLPDLPDFNILIITPSLMVSTAWAYQNYKIGLTKKQKNSTLSSFKFDHLTRHQLVDLCQNDLEAGVFEAHPELALIKSRLLQCGALVASMTGSGSAVYGIFRTLQEAQRGQRFFEKEYATHVTKPVRWGIREVYQNYETLTSGG
ncbi:MAG: hypothetical protein ONA90_11035, partial [candidate division KSB1 bacterium]|nr:hypothetical protein [candidate division KSB1 bacterium]